MGIVILCKSPTVLHAHSGSTAEKYAKSHGLEFVSLDAAIITQPVNTVVAKAGDNASVKFTAKGDGLTYTWYFKDKGTSAFTKSSITYSTYSAALTDGKRQVSAILCKKQQPCIDSGAQYSWHSKSKAIMKNGAACFDQLLRYFSFNFVCQQVLFRLQNGISNCQISISKQKKTS